MTDDVLLNTTTISNHNSIFISTQHCIIPNTRIHSDLYITDKLHPCGNEYRRMNLRNIFLITIKHSHPLLYNKLRRKYIQLQPILPFSIQKNRLSKSLFHPLIKLTFKKT